MSSEKTGGESDSSVAAHSLEDVEAGRALLAAADSGDPHSATQVYVEQRSGQILYKATREVYNESEESSSDGDTSLAVPTYTQKITRLNSLLLNATKSGDLQDIERLLKAGANPNATCGINGVSVCHMAALRTDEALSILLKAGAKRYRLDEYKLTPLHFAAWAGNDRHIALLLDMSRDFQNTLDPGDNGSRQEETEDLRLNLKEFLNTKQRLFKIDCVDPQWMDNRTYHNCREFSDGLPRLYGGWTALHAASSSAQPRCVRKLLAAGADASARDISGRTPFDVAGAAIYYNQHVDVHNFTEVIKILIREDRENLRTEKKKKIGTPLHRAVELGSLEAVTILIDAKVPLDTGDYKGETALHLCVEKKLKEHLQILASHKVAGKDEPRPIDVRDSRDRTVLHKAVLESWEPGVSILIENGADITAQDYNQETAIHFAAAIGNVNILNQLLNTEKHKIVIDMSNKKGETALFKAVSNGHLECVKCLLEKGANIMKTFSNKMNLFHIAAEKGYLEVLTALLDHDYSIARTMINELTEDDDKGYSPIHFAVQNNHPECASILFSRNDYRHLRTSCGINKGSMPLHIAAIYNNVETAKIISFKSDFTDQITNDMQWTPLHAACHYGSRDMIKHLLEGGADLSRRTDGPNECRITAFDMLMNNLPKPTEFMESIFDSYISTNDLNLQDPNCEVTVNFQLFLPKLDENDQIKVIDALLKTGDRYGQSRLLLHPLLESFLYLKWKALLPFFYTVICFYAFFVLSLTLFVLSVFFYKDIKDTAPLVLNSTLWVVVLYITIFLIVCQEVLYLKLSNGYFRQLETWVKFSSVCLAAILPFTTRLTLSEVVWPRHVATGAILLSWLEMMFLLSRFPNWGYYVLMFGKVSTNVLKILLTFAFLLIGFSLSFMIQFHSQPPFESPWAALVKTIVMMTSEFDYGDLVEESDPAVFVKSILVVRVIFLMFVMFAAIVLMNLMVGVAVNDLYNLEVIGNVRRLAKQVELIGILENLYNFNRFRGILPYWLENVLRGKKCQKMFVIRPNEPKSRNYKMLPSHIREALFEKAQCRYKQTDDEVGSQNYREKLDEIHNEMVTVKTMMLQNKSQADIDFKEITNKIVKIESSISQMNSSINELNRMLARFTRETKDPHRRRRR
ncbi:transient receptor potential channel pyrexia isoform X1 [Helicoverpa armigera]|uniref:transient receptor potential channel pyrexia isoform X1 n=1 Tax=Helicoverpa armigera TaxID=29058 RepID=UPI003083C0A1